GGAVRALPRRRAGPASRPAAAEGTDQAQAAVGEAGTRERTSVFALRGSRPGGRSHPRERLCRDDVDQLRGPDDDLAHARLRGGPDLLALHGERLEIRLADVRGDLDPVAHLALDLDDAGDGRAGQLRLIGDGEGLPTQ